MDSQTIKYWAIGIMIFALGVLVGRELLRAEIRWAIQDIADEFSEWVDESENQDDSAKHQPRDEALPEYSKWLDEYQTEFQDVLDQHQAKFDDDLAEYQKR